MPILKQKPVVAPTFAAPFVRVRAEDYLARFGQGVDVPTLAQQPVVVPAGAASSADAHGIPRFCTPTQHGRVQQTAVRARSGAHAIRADTTNEREQEGGKEEGEQWQGKEAA